MIWNFSVFDNPTGVVKLDYLAISKAQVTLKPTYPWERLSSRDGGHQFSFKIAAGKPLPRR